ncbi:MAG: hypothetical protein AAF657_20135 [Acidobacteriota bacterium]
MTAATTTQSPTFRLSDEDIDAISRIAQDESLGLAYAAKEFMKLASTNVAQVVAESLTQALNHTETEAVGLQPEDLQPYVEGLNMKWEWNTPQGTPVSKTATAILQPYDDSSTSGAIGFPQPKSLQVGVGIEF